MREECRQCHWQAGDPTSQLRMSQGKEQQGVVQCFRGAPKCGKHHRGSSDDGQLGSIVVPACRIFFKECTKEKELAVF